MPYFSYALAVLLGTIFGFAFGRIYTAVAGTGTTREYWTAVGKAVRGLLYGEDEQFWQHYFGIIGASLRYLGRQLLALGLSLAPLVVLSLVIVPLLWPAWHRSAAVAVVPSSAGTVLFAAEDPAAGDRHPALFRSSDGMQITLANRFASYVVCGSSSAACYVLLGLGFAKLPGPAAAADDQPMVVIRPYHDDWNPLWPYLNDAEFLFFLSLSVMSVAFFVRHSSRARSTGKTHGIGSLDFFLTELATGGNRFFKRLGDWETRRYASNLADYPITKPVFIAGLARSGTTILLEKIAALEGVATHRYRDFPFIMTPVIWNRFLSLFGASQVAVERPHKDRIRITRDSSEAFEEPVWQYFFGNLHDGRSSGVLGRASTNAEFEPFYRDHLKKILYLRRGTRYVSKGNYNVTRIEYIGKIFDDARIIVPIRHPLTHVRSLVRQHRQFTDYAKNDARVADYMRAVGHYEFGPQRMPIVTTDSNAESALACWDAGREAEGYAWQWRDVYGYVASLVRGDPAIAARIRVIRYEDLCADPAELFERLLRFIDMPYGASIETIVAGITPIDEHAGPASAETDSCWSIVENVASIFGYANDTRTRSDSNLVL